MAALTQSTNNLMAAAGQVEGDPTDALNTDIFGSVRSPAGSTQVAQDSSLDQWDDHILYGSSAPFKPQIMSDVQSPDSAEVVDNTEEVMSVLSKRGVNFSERAEALQSATNPGSVINALRENEMLEPFLLDHSMTPEGLFDRPHRSVPEVQRLDRGRIMKFFGQNSDHLKESEVNIIFERLPFGERIAFRLYEMGYSDTPATYDPKLNTHLTDGIDPKDIVNGYNIDDPRWGTGIYSEFTSPSAKGERLNFFDMSLENLDRIELGIEMRDRPKLLAQSKNPMTNKQTIKDWGLYT